MPIFATVVSKTNIKNEDKSNEKINYSLSADHHEDFLNLIAEESGCSLKELLDIDLYLYDTQKAVCFL